MRTIVKYINVLLLWSVWTVAASAAEPLILAIESYHHEDVWDISWKQGLNERVKDGFRIEYFEMDTRRISPSAYEAQADRAWKRYTTLQPDLVILADDNALKYLAPRLAKTQTPVVYLGINANPRSYIPSEAENFTGVLERPLLWHSLRTIDALIPINEILVLLDSSTTAQAVIDTIFQGETHIMVRHVMVDIHCVSTWKAWQEAVNAAPEQYDIIVVGLYHTLITAQGRHVPAEEVIAWTSRYALLPLFAFWDFAVGKEKTIGGLVLSGEEQGEIAGRIAKTILQGTPPKAIFPESGERGRLLFSTAQLRKYYLTLPQKLARKAEYIE